MTERHVVERGIRSTKADHGAARALEDAEVDFVGRVAVPRRLGRCVAGGPRRGPVDAKPSVDAGPRRDPVERVVDRGGREVRREERGVLCKVDADRAGGHRSPVLGGDHACIGQRRGCWKAERVRDGRAGEDAEGSVGLQLGEAGAHAEIGVGMEAQVTRFDGDREVDGDAGSDVVLGEGARVDLGVGDAVA